MPQLPRFSRSSAIAIGLYGLLWALLLSDWLWWNWLANVIDRGWWRAVTPVLQWIGFTGAIAVGGLWIVWSKRWLPVARAGIYTACYVPAWHWLVFTTDAVGLDFLRVAFANAGLGGLFLLGLAWVVWGVENASRFYVARRESARRVKDANIDRALPAKLPVPQKPSRERPRKRLWNPLDPDAWYYGRHSPRLNQSIAALTSYALAFLLAFLLFTRIGGCREIYEMPAGGGVQKTITQTVRIQKVVKKKFVINPFSSIIFNPPPIDDIKLQLEQVTAHLYRVGYGEGDGAGFSGGTKKGKVRFIRLEYQGGDWDQDFGVGSDLNMLIQYGVLTGHQVHDQTESRTVAQLRNFPAGKCPPFVYLTGQRNITLSASEAKILKEYLIDKHGMLFGDNGGSPHFHNQFFAMMRTVLGPGVEPVKIPLDDVIHRVPFQIPFLPYVAPHGGKDAWGWKVDGRWVCYYHPGDIGDAWTDDHSGVSREIYEACYQLGTNVIFYAHTEYNKWLDAQKK